MVKFDTLSIIIPVYNEARTIHQILDLLRELELVNNIGKKIILVNDYLTAGSGDTIWAHTARYPEMDLHLLRARRESGQGRDRFWTIFCILKYGLLGQQPL